MSSLVVFSSQAGLGACSHRRSARFHGTYAAVSRPYRRVSAAASRCDLVDIHPPGLALLLWEKIKMTGHCQSDSHRAEVPVAARQSLQAQRQILPSSGYIRCNENLSLALRRGGRVRHPPPLGHLSDHRPAHHGARRATSPPTGSSCTRTCLTASTRSFPRSHDQRRRQHVEHRHDSAGRRIPPPVAQPPQAAATSTRPVTGGHGQESSSSTRTEG